MTKAKYKSGDIVLAKMYIKYIEIWDGKPIYFLTSRAVQYETVAVPEGEIVRVAK